MTGEVIPITTKGTATAIVMNAITKGTGFERNGKNEGDGNARNESALSGNVVTIETIETTDTETAMLRTGATRIDRRDLK